MIPEHKKDYEFVGIQEGINGEDYLLFNELQTKSTFPIGYTDVLFAKNFTEIITKKIEEIRQNFKEKKK